MRRVAALVVVLLPLAWAGCNAILGNDDGVYVPGGPDASSGDAPAESDRATPSDAPVHDAPANADVGAPTDAASDVDASVTSDAADAADAAGDAGPSDAASCADANFGTDPNNCGTCGRVCGADAGCRSGLCDPITVASGLNGPAAIAADTSGVYFTTTGTSTTGDKYATEGVFTCPNAGCPTSGPTPLAIDQETPVAVALDSANVYWLTADNETVWACTKGTCTARVVNAQAGTYLTSMTLGGTALYWTDGVGNVVLSCPTTATCTTPAQVAKLGASTSPGPISFLGNTVFWANNVTGAGSVMSCAAGGCGTSPTTLVPSVASPLAVFADVTGVYFTSATAGALERVGLDGGAIEDGGALLQGLFYPSGLVVDGTYAYVADSAGGNVWRVAIDGSSAPVAIAMNQNSPTAVAVEATWVYWTNAGMTKTDGTVMKVAK